MAGVSLSAQRPRVLTPFEKGGAMDARRIPYVLAMLATSMFVPPALAEQIWALMDDYTLVNFDSATPSVCSSRPITGLITGDVMKGIDYRPQAPFGRLYALTYNTTPFNCR